MQENIQANKIKKIRFVGNHQINNDFQIIKSINMNEMIKNFKEAQIARRQFGEKKIKKNHSNKIS